MTVIEATAAPLADHRPLPLRSPGLRHVRLSVGHDPARRSPTSSGPEPWQREILRAGLGAGADEHPTRPCARPSPRATASASRRWSRGSSCGRCRRCATRAASSPPTPRASCAPRPGPSSPSGMGSAINRDWFTYTATALHSVLPGHDRTWRVDCHHLVGEQHRGHRRPAQQGPPRLRPVRRGLVHPRRGVGDHRGRADRRRHRALLVRLRQSRRATPAASANASPAAASPIAGSRCRSIRARSSMTNKAQIASG